LKKTKKVQLAKLKGPFTSRATFEAKRHVVRRPADCSPGAEYKQVLAGKNSSESTINVPSLKLWQQTMKELREKKLANKDKSSMPTATDTHQSQGSRFVNNEMKQV
jgi:hypothetical protein